MLGLMRMFISCLLANVGFHCFRRLLGFVGLRLLRLLGRHGDTLGLEPESFPLQRTGEFGLMFGVIRCTLA